MSVAAAVALMTSTAVEDGEGSFSPQQLTGAPSTHDLTAAAGIAGQPSDAYAAAAHQERRIPSRYVEGIRNAFDPTARQDHLARAFREGLQLLRADADRHRLLEEEALANALEGLGATRRRSNLSSSGDGGSLRSRREAAEKATEHWANVLSLIDTILCELDDHQGMYTETFLHTMEMVTHEFKTAPWNDPARDPWDAITSLTPALLDAAREAPSAAVSHNAFRLEQRGRWSVADAAKGSRVAATSPPLSALLQASSPTMAALATDSPLSLPPASNPPPQSRASQRRASTAVLGSSKGSVALMQEPATPTVPPPQRSSTADITADESTSAAPSTGLLKQRISSFSSAAAVGLAAVAFRDGSSKAFLADGATASDLGSAVKPPVAATPPVPRLRITCMTSDAGEVAVGSSGGDSSTWETVYIGTTGGDLLGIPASKLRGDPAGAGESGSPAAASPSGPRSGGAASPSRANTPQTGGAFRASSPTVPKAGGRAGTGPGKRRAAQALAQQELANTGPFADLPGVRVFLGHMYPVRCLCAFTHKDQRLLASSSDDKTVRVHNVATKETVFVIADNRSVVSGLVYHRAISRLLLGGLDGSLACVEPKYGQRAFLVNASTGLGNLESIAVSDNFPGSSAVGPIYVGTRSGAVYALRPVEPASQLNGTTEVACDAIYIADRQKIPERLPFPVPSSADGVCRGGHTSPITCIAAPHEPFLFTGDASGRVSLWCTQRGHRRRSRHFYGHVDAVSGIEVTSDGFMITTSLDATIVAWSWRDGSLLARLSPHFHKVTGLLLGTQPRAKVDVASLIVSANNAMRSGTSTSDRWPNGSAIALRYLPGVVECTLVTSSLDESLNVMAIVYDQSQQ